MNERVDSYIIRGLLIAGVLLFAVNLSSCANCANLLCTKTIDDAVAMEPEEETMEALPEEPPEETVELMVADDIYVVVAGDSLWAISSLTSIYNDAFRWPLIYSNNDQIENADLIYPGEELAIRRDLSRDDINSAVEHAKNRGVRSYEDLMAYDSAYRKSAMMMAQ